MKLTVFFAITVQLYGQTTTPASGPYTHGPGASKPAVCSIGALYQADDGVAGQNLYTCTAANTWALLGAGWTDNGTTTSTTRNVVVGNTVLGTGSFQLIKLPDQTTFTGTIVFGNGGGALVHTSGEDGFYNTFVGTDAGDGNTTGNRNTAVGQFALKTNSTGNNNVALGQYALFLSTTASYNTALGTDALNQTTTGHDNVAIGQGASFYGTTAHENVAIGASTLSANVSGAYNMALGFGALQYVDGDNNVAVGYFAGKGVSGGSAVSSNTLIGYRAGASIVTGADSNIFIGTGAGYNTTTGSHNILIGNALDTAGHTDTYKLNIGGIIKGDLSTLALTIPGTLISTDNANADGNNLTVNTTNKSGVYAYSVQRSSVDVGGLDIRGGYRAAFPAATSNYPMISGTGIWNNGAVVFTNHFVNITDTASDPASLLTDLQVGSASKFSVRKDGLITTAASTIVIGGHTCSIVATVLTCP